MLPTERHHEIENALKSSRVIATEDLARLLSTSVETIRRDFIVLERRGVLTRVHGGAVGAGAVFTASEPSFADRSSMSLNSKASIGAVAAGLVSDGQTVFLDVGTTALEVARAWPKHFRGTVATCSMLVAAELAGREGVQVLLSGGRVRAGDLALSNSVTVGFFLDLHADIAFLGSGGVDVAAGLTDFHLDEVATRRVLIANSTTSYVLADHSKLGLVAPHRVCGLESIDGVITDGPVQPELLTAIERAGGVLIAA